MSGENGLIRWPCVGRAGAEPPIAGARVSRCVHHARRRQYATRPGGGVAVRACVGVTALSAANKTLLALLPDLAVLPVLSTVVRLARSAVLGFVSRSNGHYPDVRHPRR